MIQEPSAHSADRLEIELPLYAKDMSGLGTSGHASEPYPVFRRFATPNDSGDYSTFFAVQEICDKQSVAFLYGAQGVGSHHRIEETVIGGTVSW